MAIVYEIKTTEIKPFTYRTPLITPDENGELSIKYSRQQPKHIKKVVLLNLVGRNTNGDIVSYEPMEQVNRFLLAHHLNDNKQESEQYSKGLVHYFSFLLELQRLWDSEYDEDLYEEFIDLPRPSWDKFPFRKSDKATYQYREALIKTVLEPDTPNHAIARTTAIAYMGAVVKFYSFHIRNGYKFNNPPFEHEVVSVILERTVRELNGESSISLEEAPPAKQQIVCSRSFGERITDKDAMHQAVVQYAERAAEKLRGERQYCRQVTTFVRTSPFAVKEPCYSNAAVEKLPLPTQDSRDIIAAACRALNHVWREGYRYMKAGVMLADFTPSGIAQPGLFDEIQPRKNSEKLMKTLDELNQSGKGKVWFAGRGTAPEWQMKREMLSQCYTTKWRDIPLARLG